MLSRNSCVWQLIKGCFYLHIVIHSVKNIQNIAIILTLIEQMFG